MDIVFLTGLRIDTVIGIYDWERKIRQTVVIDLQMGTDIQPAAANDDIKLTLDYEGISNRIKDFVGASSYGLIESMAENIASIVISEFSVPWVRLTVHKPGAVPAANDVGVIIERGSRVPQSPEDKAS